MKRTAASVVVGLLIALCGSACGSFLLNGIPSGGESTIVSTIATTLGPPPMTGTLLTRSGSGSQTLGTFNGHGELHVTVSCTGTGALEVEFVSRQMGEGTGEYCPAKNFGVSSPADGAQVKIHAPAGVRWTATVTGTN